MAKKKKHSYAMTKEQLQLWIHLRKKCSVMKSKKGKGSYNRQKFKSFSEN